LPDDDPFDDPHPVTASASDAIPAMNPFRPDISNLDLMSDLLSRPCSQS